MSGPRVILARHAETDANLRLSLDSEPPGGPLTERGRGQADELADVLAAEPVVAVYASAALRARQTARPVARRHGLAVQVVDELREIFIGDREGRNDAESLQMFGEVFQAWLGGALERSLPGGETGRAAVDRFAKALREITASHTGGAVVVVSHGALLHLATPLQTNNLDVADTGLIRLPNTARIVLEEDSSAGGGWHCVEWAGIHLGAAT